MSVVQETSSIPIHILEDTGNSLIFSNKYHEEYDPEEIYYSQESDSEQETIEEKEWIYRDYIYDSNLQNLDKVLDIYYQLNYDFPWVFEEPINIFVDFVSKYVEEYDTISDTGSLNLDEFSQSREFYIITRLIRQTFCHRDD
ncbi:MAG TPA: hypothetical protein V6C58_14255 [Allocoleopsis sp.]